MNSQPSSSSTRAMVRDGGGAPATTIAHPVAAGDLAVPVGGGVEHGVPDRRRAAHQRHAVLLDPAEDLGAVDLAQHHLRRPEPGHRVRHPPAVAVEHRQRVQVDVAVADLLCMPKVTALTQMLRWVICTPLGRAVVPQV